LAQRACGYYYLYDKNLVLEIDGITGAENQAEVSTRTAEEVGFAIVRRRPGRYSVFVSSVSWTFHVTAPKKCPAIFIY